MLNLSETEFKELKKHRHSRNTISNTGKPRSLHKNHKTHATKTSEQKLARIADLHGQYLSAVDEIHFIQTAINKTAFGSHPILLWTERLDDSRADDSNVFKAVEDALQGVAYDNDSQVETFRRPFPWGDSHD